METTLQAAVGDFDDVGIGHASEEIIKLGRGHHVCDHPAGQAELAASLGSRGGGQKLVGGPFRYVLHEGWAYLGAVECGGRVVDPLPDLVLRRSCRDTFGAYTCNALRRGVDVRLEPFLCGRWGKNDGDGSLNVEGKK